MTDAAARRRWLLACGCSLVDWRAAFAGAATGAPPGAGRPGPAAPERPATPADALALGLVHRPIPSLHPSRAPARPMRPRWITVHATGNPDPRADALAHARLLERGLASPAPQSRRGWITWHATVDATTVVQHLPLREQGDHADFDGPGNRESVGLEIAAGPRGHDDPAAALARAAQAVAALLVALSLEPARVVPHWHWPQPPDGRRKACPQALVGDEGPGAAWQAFVRDVRRARARLARAGITAEATGWIL